MRMEKSAKMPVWAIVLIVISIVIFILVILFIVIGIFGYYAFRSGALTASNAVVRAPFKVQSSAVDSSGITLMLQNVGGETLTIKSIEISGCGSTNPNILIANEGLENIVIQCQIGSIDSFKGDITITYNKEGSSLDMTSTGSIYSNPQTSK
jgi:hypothetical protein